ncbi:hypothetical protein E2C01_052681 [Portunus trituberculatus]|uniref:Uncharacterized protein n=1 Tax=Portunus trituberculatus TaxID=210409 RepID=A0A5B7GQ14_PORTR|nr:hypothetical protein [Portunus trituberculatus]
MAAAHCVHGGLVPMRNGAEERGDSFKHQQREEIHDTCHTDTASHTFPVQRDAQEPWRRKNEIWVTSRAPSGSSSVGMKDEALIAGLIRRFPLFTKLQAQNEVSKGGA